MLDKATEEEALALYAEIEQQQGKEAAREVLRKKFPTGLVEEIVRGTEDKDTIALIDYLDTLNAHGSDEAALHLAKLPKDQAEHLESDLKRLLVVRQTLKSMLA